MLRTFVTSALRSVCRQSPVAPSLVPLVQRTQRANLVTLACRSSLLPAPSLVAPAPQLLRLPGGLAATGSPPTTRNVTKFSLIKGKRKTAKAVLKRFKRLEWGAWIRTHSGRQKKLFKKSAALRRRLKQHVFTNATQSWLLDKMVTSFWRRPKHYINDPYRPYHSRNEYFATESKTFKV
ncbi:39S ribosomal protein L35, mitochondrial [Drosophila subpulchrella]|uniref:39S ribosomal protein L35, mitochondrial n=1 Tax=Drosophila subpulchrella TaxID=1486046 RepID=UPI0018A1A631|nr:39S ribosomal protein L35, mitochondrial [Drosophila subpulchrella]